MKHSYILAGTNFGNIARLIGRNGIGWNPKYWLRALFLLQNGIWASILAKREKKQYGKQLETQPTPDNPIVIIGHWRTGSTFLHQLMSMDPNLVTPSVFQVTAPDSFLISRKFYQPVMSAMLGKQRPMDSVKIGFDEPQEDEYALIKLALDSPLEQLIFPKKNGYFLTNTTNFVPKKINLQKWKLALSGFCKKLILQSGKQVVLKNPFHSLRIKLLYLMFPNIRFVHIYRNPLNIIPSTMHMWDIVGRQNALKPAKFKPSVTETCQILDRFWTTIETDLKEIPPGQYAEIRFETLELDPLSTIKELYSHLSIEFSQEFETRIIQFLKEIKSYKKNTYQLSQDDTTLISKLLAPHIKRFGYDIINIQK